MEIPRAIQEGVKAVYEWAFPFATALAAVGVISMAFIQTVKDMVPLRRWFQAWWVKGWLQNQARQARLVQGFEADPEEAEKDLIRLATSGDREALYDLPIEQVSGQMNAATQIVLDYPWHHPHLLYCLAAQASAEDVKKLVGARPLAEKPRAQLTEEEKSRLADLVDPRNRVTHQVQRSLDGLQISAGFRWKLCLQIASIVLSGLFIVAGLWLFTNEPILTFRRLGLYLVAAILGGFLAPVARDLVAALQQLRK